MDRQTGQVIGDLDHLRQSIIDIVTTPLGSRVYRRDYGCGIFDLIDQPVNATLVTRMTAAIAEALDKWEPRLQVTRIVISDIDLPDGRLAMDIEGYYLPNGQPVRLDKVEVPLNG